MKNCIKVGSDFSGVGAFNQSLKRLEINYEEIFACDMDKYARQTFIHNYGEPKYYPTNVYDREIPKESLDIYMTSPPCQAFSLAGKRLGKDDKRGILFFNSLEFIQINKPRFFIFENVKGLLSDDGGKTFSEWVNLLGGKSINGNTTLFPFEESVPYHLYWQVLNAKNYGVPQNRERVFLIGIRDDLDNNFRFPIEEKLNKKLKDVLEQKVNKKYFLSEKMLNFVLTTTFRESKPIDINNDIAPCVKVGGDVSCFDTNKLKIKSATSKGYEEAIEGDSINFSVPNSKTRRGRVGKQVAQTLDTACNQAVMVIYTNPIVEYQLTGGKWDKTHEQSGRVYHKNGIAPTIHTMGGGNQEPKIFEQYKIRKLTPRECFRLMDFPDTFSWPVSDSQAYKQAGNSIVVNVLAKIIKRLPL